MVHQASQVVHVSVMPRVLTRRNIPIELLPDWVPLILTQPILTAQPKRVIICDHGLGIWRQIRSAQNPGDLLEYIREGWCPSAPSPPALDDILNNLSTFCGGTLASLQGIVHMDGRPGVTEHLQKDLHLEERNADMLADRSDLLSHYSSYRI
ncbi:uncharacterized protein FTOL_02099 [Fusarium torulosum]|uniref:Uncharacterized protein n=1 Tax=Fusarium torulosum TaxID=33205 RepID=A0AAE8M143_9HYPO|nr:uncharacterized protein FTOL_02099 [Fusarium torulosum]